MGLQSGTLSRGEALKMDQTQILETLKSNFLFNFRTGNVMVDTFVTGIIIMLSTYLLNMSNNLFNFDWSSWFSNLNLKREARIVISGRKLQGSHQTRLEYKHYFETELPSSFDTSRLQDDIYSPAEVTQVFLNNMHKPEEGLEQLASQTATNIRLQGEKCPFSSAPSSPAKQNANNE